MAEVYLKKADKTPATDEGATRDVVSSMLHEIRTHGETAARRYARELDGWVGDVVVSRAEIEQAASRLSRDVQEDIRFAYGQIYGFAVRQRESIHAFETEISPGVIAGQRLVPVGVAGCYVPGGRFPHVASALMSLATAKAAGVPFIVAATPPRRGEGIHPATLFAMSLCGPDVVLAIGGVQGVASLAFGLFSGKPADVLVGPGNRYVAEAKRILYGDVGIDFIAGPSEILIIADETADPEIVAADIVGQTEHGVDSPATLVTTSQALARAVLERVPSLIDQLPSPEASRTSWENYGSVIVTDSREEAVRISDDFAPEHLEIHARDLEWWFRHVTNYGSLFLGEETTVAYGDKAAGPNHILPTRKAARYTGGLSVGKFLKVLTYQRLSPEASRRIGAVSARISRLEGMEAHARSCETRLRKYSPGSAGG